jgi:hypothetical protein
MSALAAYFDALNVSFLEEDDSGKLSFFNFPYAYSPEIFSNFCSQDQFYKSLFDTILKERKTKLSQYEVITTGFLQPPKLPFDVKYSANLTDLLSKVKGYYPILVSNFSVATKSDVTSLIPFINDATSPEFKIADDQADYYANLSIYPQLVPMDMAAQIDLDQALLKSVPQEMLSKLGTDPIVLTGSRFLPYQPNREPNYVFMLNLIKKPGFYQFYLDKNNALILLQLLKTFKKAQTKATYAFDNYIESAGTFVSTTCDSECMLTTDVGTSQFFEVTKNNIYILPLDKDSKATLSIKSHDLGSVEKQVKGGAVGLVIDSRENKTAITDEIKIFNDCIKQLRSCL